MSSTFDDKAIGERLLSIRTEKGLSQQAIADALGVSLRTYQNYERGDRPVSKELLCSLVEKYRVDIAWVLTGERTSSDARPSEIDAIVFENVTKALASEESEYRCVNSADFARMTSLIYNQVCRIQDPEEQKSHIKSAVIMLSVSMLRQSIKQMTEHRDKLENPNLPGVFEKTIFDMESRINKLMGSIAKTPANDKN